MRRFTRLLVVLLFPLLALQVLLIACADQDNLIYRLRDSTATATGAAQTPTLTVAATAATPALPVSPTAAAAQAGDLAARVITRTNTYRAANGCAALSASAILMATAQAHSQDMALSDFVGHQSSDGTGPWDRIKAAGYNYQLVAENISWGSTSPDAVVDSWFNESPPDDLHRKNILNCALRNIGVGYYYLANDPGRITAHAYWTQDFGTPLHG
jgi:uncharacterized protein YkwD